jgi:hypothetical protein
MMRRDRPDSSWANATWALLYYVVVPSVLLTAIMWRFPELSQEHFLEMLRWVLILGTLLVGVNALRAEFETGTVPRLGLDGLYVVLAIIWLLGVLGGGTVLEQSWNGYVFFIDVRGLFTIVAALASLNLVYYALRFGQERGLLPQGGGDPNPDAEVDTDDGGVTIEYVEDGLVL